MHIIQESSQAIYQITGYDTGAVWVNQERLIRHFILWPHQLMTDWPVSSYAHLKNEDFKPILDTPSSILLLGAGKDSQLPNYALFSILYAQGISVEVMSTAAACRTFNILSSEGRSVTAAIIVE